MIDASSQIYTKNVVLETCINTLSTNKYVMYLNFLIIQHVFICCTYYMIQFGKVLSPEKLYFLALLFSENFGFTCYFQTFILNSCKKVGDMGFPFGYLKASSNLQTVNLFVMPYNFPVLFPIVGKNINLRVENVLIWFSIIDNEFIWKH